MRVSTWQSALPISRLSRAAVLLNGCPNASLKRNYATSGSSPLLSAAQLKKAIESSSRPVLLDCTWFMPNVPRDAFAEFKQSRIPGARFFNLDEVIDKASPYPHMLPSAEDFAKAVGISSFPLY
jgi:3-mercaptopyruvate sulfurtransferase SseA